MSKRNNEKSAWNNRFIAAAEEFQPRKPLCGILIKNRKIMCWSEAWKERMIAMQKGWRRTASSSSPPLFHSAGRRLDDNVVAWEITTFLTSFFSAPRSTAKYLSYTSRKRTTLIENPTVSQACISHQEQLELFRRTVQINIDKNLQ